MSRKRTAVITGASSGIGAACARHLAAAGFTTILGARRLERLTEIAHEIGGTAIELDVTESNSISRFVGQIESCDVLVNNAGFAHGLDPILDTSVDDWQAVYDVNVVGTVAVTKALQPVLE